MSFVIETDVPMVSSPRGRKPTEFPLTDMEVGNSFLIAIEGEGDDFTKGTESWRRKLRIATKRFSETYEGKFSTAVVQGGLRVYRVA